MNFLTTLKTITSYICQNFYGSEVYRMFQGGSAILWENVP
jgi:hypothetical protein